MLDILEAVAIGTYLASKLPPHLNKHVNIPSSYCFECTKCKLTQTLPFNTLPHKCPKCGGKEFKCDYTNTIWRI